MFQYPYKRAKGDVGRYIARFKTELGPSHSRFMNLVARGMNNTVIEFDTVINQMMIYVLLRAIPENNAFYRRLRVVAQEAHDYREAARAG